MEALANIARQNTTAAPSNPSLPAQEPAYKALSGPQSSVPPPLVPSAMTYTQPAYQMPPVAQPVNMGTMPFTFPPQAAPSGQPVGMPGMPGVASSQASVFPGVTAPAPPVAAAGGLDPNMQQQLILIKALAESGVPFDQIPALIQSMTAAGGAAAPGAPQATSTPPNPYAAQQQGWGAPVESRDIKSFHDGVRSPNRYRGRSRSRSPGRQWDSRDSPRGTRDQFQDYGRSSPGRTGHDDRGRGGRGRGGGTAYRQRSPAGRRGRSPSPRRDNGVPTEKWIEYDPTIPNGHIKVLSRNLFVGGVT
jgi:protein NRD1